MSDQFRTLIIPAAQVITARNIADSWGSAGKGMWTTPLSPDGTEPATHYVSTGYISAEFAHLVPCQTWEQDEGGVWVQTNSEFGDINALMAWLSEQEVDISIADVEQLYEMVDVTEQKPLVALERLGLKVVTTNDI